MFRFPITLYIFFVGCNSISPQNFVIRELPSFIYRHVNSDHVGCICENKRTISLEEYYEPFLSFCHNELTGSSYFVFKRDTFFVEEQVADNMKLVEMTLLRDTVYCAISQIKNNNFVSHVFFDSQNPNIVYTDTVATSSCSIDTLLLLERYWKHRKTWQK